jgi:hypothetical protein
MTTSPRLIVATAVLTAMILAGCGSSMGTVPPTVPGSLSNCYGPCAVAAYEKSGANPLHSPGLDSALASAFNTAAENDTGAVQPDGAGDPSGQYHFAYDTQNSGECRATENVASCTVVIDFESGPQAMDATPGGAAYCTQTPGCDPTAASNTIGAYAKFDASLARYTKNCINATLVPVGGWYTDPGSALIAPASGVEPPMTLTFKVADPTSDSSQASPC